MKGMEHVIAIRQRRAKPDAVTVRLVDEPAELPGGFSWLDFGADSGHVTVEVPSSDRLNDLDMRPLHGLLVTVEDITGDTERHRRLAALVAAVDPETLVMPVYAGDRLTVHIRRDGATETYAL